MPGRVAVVGVGRIGLRVAWDLSSRGYDVVLVDASLSSLRRASGVVGGETRLVDASSPRALAQALSDVDAAVLALPGSLEAKPLEGVIEAGVDAVDVSFYRGIPGEYAVRARREGVNIVVDAGVAPGLSNMLVARAYRLLGRLREAYILVGGISEDPREGPLGLAATWNAEDLIDEYLRPARMMASGRVVSVDPLSLACRVRIGGSLELEAFPTDGLRSLLHTMAGKADSLVEYTLRHPGHLGLVASLKELGLLSETPIHADGCMVRPRSLLARLIEERGRNVRDLVVLAVKARGGGGERAWLSIVRPEGRWSAMALATASFAAAVLEELVSQGWRGDPGIHYPEELGLGDASDSILGALRSRGVRVDEVDPGEVLIHECSQPPPTPG